MRTAYRPCSERTRNAQLARRWNGDYLIQESFESAARVYGRKRLGVANNSKKVTLLWK